jgi:hypothetical protein
MAAASDRGEEMEGQTFPWQRFCEIPFESRLGTIIPEFTLAAAQGTSTYRRFLDIERGKDHARTVTGR